MPEREALEKESDMGAMPASLGATAWGSVALAAAGEDGPARVLRPWGRRGDVRLEPGKDGEPARRAGKRTELTAQTSLPPGFLLSHPLPPRGWFLFSGCVSCPCVLHLCLPPGPLLDSRSPRDTPNSWTWFQRWTGSWRSLTSPLSTR